MDFSKSGQILQVHFISRRTPVVCFHVSKIALTLKKHNKGHWNWQEQIKLNGNYHHKQDQRFHFDISQKMAFLHAAQQPDDNWLLHGMNTIFMWELGLTLHGWTHIFITDEHCFCCCCCCFRGEGNEGCSFHFYNTWTLIFTTDEHWLLHKPTRFLEEPIKCLKPKSSLTSGFHAQLLSPEI